jgi:hypothetical protein
MFKHLLIILLIILIIYFIIKKFILLFHKLILSKFIIKYDLIDSDKQFLDLYSNEFNINILESLKDRMLFYTDTTWNTKNNNYIYDKINDKFYIIDSGYYYYIESPENFKLVIGSQNSKVKLFDLNTSNRVIIIK